MEETRKAEFKRWMADARFKENTIGTRVSNCERVEEILGCKLDERYAADGGMSVLRELKCSKGEAHPLARFIDGDAYNGLATLHQAAKLYFEFRSGEKHVKRGSRRGKANPVRVYRLDPSDGWHPEGPARRDGTDAERERSSEAGEASPAAPFSEISALWGDYMGATNRMARALGRSANIVGEYAERLVAEYYGGELLAASSKSADIRLRDGRLVQVKSRVPRQATTTSLSPIRSWDFDLLAVVLFGENGGVLRALEMPAAAAREHARPDGHQNAEVIVTTGDFLNDPRAWNLTASPNSLMAG